MRISMYGQRDGEGGDDDEKKRKEIEKRIKGKIRVERGKMCY